MNRRQWLVTATSLGVPVAVGGVWVRHSVASSRLREKLRKASLPIWVKGQLADTSEIPAACADRIRIWFHKNCLKTKEFASAITAEGFRMQMEGCADETKQAMLLAAFCLHVRGPSEISNMVEDELNTATKAVYSRWEISKSAIALAWETPLQEYSSPAPLSEIEASINQKVTDAMKQIVKASASTNQLVTTTETLKSVKDTVFLTMDRADTRIAFSASMKGAQVEANLIDNILALPGVFVDAFARFYRWFSDSSKKSINSMREQIQSDVSTELSRLGNELSDLVAEELKKAMAAVHDKQQEAINEAAERIVSKSVHLLW